MYLFVVYVYVLWKYTISWNLRGHADLKHRGKAHEEDVAMDMDIDLSTG